MKRYTSKFFKSVSLLYMAFPLAYIPFAAILFDVPADKCVRILLSPFYYILSAIIIGAGYCLWEWKRYGWYLFLLSNLFIGYENALIVNEFGESHHKILAFIFSVGLLVFLIYRMGKEIRVPYFFPKIRWWESNPRYRLSVPVSMRRKGEDPSSAEILDLSLGGCFVKLRSDLRQDDEVTLDFTVFRNQVQCAGVVVWRTGSTVTHPRGVGIKFVHLERVQRRKLRLVGRRLKKIAEFYRRSRYLLNQEDFLKRLEELEVGPRAGPVVSATDWMREAVELARHAASEDEVPVGAVVVHQGKIIGSGYNRREQDQNPVAHAEILAIQDAARALKSWRLVDCELYVTLEPCPMCLAACQQARLTRVTYGTNDPKGGALSLGYSLHEDKRTHHRFEVAHVNNEECGAVLKTFFSGKRNTLK